METERRDRYATLHACRHRVSCDSNHNQITETSSVAGGWRLRDLGNQALRLINAVDEEEEEENGISDDQKTRT